MFLIILLEGNNLSQNHSTSELHAAEGVEKPQSDDEMDVSADLDYLESKIPTDVKTIWAFERFFLVSLVLTGINIYIAVLISEYQSVRVIAIDSVLDLVVSGLSIYLVQMQQKVFQKVNNGTQNMEVNENGLIGIATIQGFIFFIGAIVILVQSLIQYTIRTSIYFQIPPEITFQIIPAMILALVITTKFGLLVYHKDISKGNSNIALKSIEENLSIDVITNISAWVILLLSAFSNWFWLYLDPLVATFIGIRMLISGVKYLKPALKIYAKHLEQKEKTTQSADALVDNHQD